jgi:cyanophycin synthetase
LKGSFFQAPGRTNVWDKLPFKVILDYGHNAAAVQAMTDLCSRIEVPGRRICVVAGPGDRRDEDIREIARIVAKGFDYLILRRDDDPRGRAPDEVPLMMMAELRNIGFPARDVEIIVDEPKAVERALQLGRRGDLVLIFGDKPSRCWKQIIYFKPDGDEQAPATPVPVVDVSGAPADALTETLLGDVEVIQDERGVRLARESSD